MTLGEVEQLYEDALQLPEGLVRDKALSGLMDRMKEEFGVPLLEDKEWEFKNRSVIAMYRKIANSRKTV